MMRLTVIAALARATALGAPRALAADAPAESATTAAVRSAPADRAVDRLQLDSTAITGNRELPKVMSIVPWKSAEPPAGPDRPMGSLIEELLSPLDRDEFRREITYFSDLSSQSADRTSPGVPQP
jgi:hypothetical protein